ncbi:hypothetical protein OEB99_02310 [Actinotalea sp. M2MS4P-6]|uniref:HEAT repeat domain-containing protein n=1 Tax=Actinotalea sp. M2MS4P-6 TaxID=2983762 RepID=UPI0021E50B16|nr:HEAT repeat domain-containing protein [Actinotalea sp. M2MS4P-6]MCV2393132.1 hypothetical protein [Actinotalea sp. M2MS4P-6]
MDYSEAGLSGHDWLSDDGWADPDSLLGQLQRGRGIGLQRALSARAADAVLMCFGQNARWDRQLEERGWYMARLVRELEIPLAELPWDAAASEMADSVVFDALLELSAHGSAEAAAMLHAHVLQAPGDQVGELALALWIGGGPAARDGLGELVLGRLDDAALAEAAWPGDDGPWAAWSADPRVAAALEARRQEEVSRVRGPRAAKPQLNGETLDVLMDLATGDAPDVRQRAAVRELVRRGETSALDLLERLDLRRPSGWAPHLTPIANGLGPKALPRARRWLTSSDPYLERVAQGIVADHGVDEDVPTIVDLFETAAASGDWLITEPLADAFGRLGVTAAREALLQAWASTQHSHARAAYLRALHDVGSPEAAELVAEATDDCESEVREVASAIS